jgi:hypothetical protein
MKRTVASRAIGQGLAKVKPASPNTLIAYAAKAGSTASDGDSKNSPFTAALVKHITAPGLDVRKAFGFVRDDVLKNTSNRQEPFVYGSLGGDDVPLVPAKAAASSAQADARKDYELALQIGNRDALNAYLAQYPDGFYASLARLQLAKIAAEETRIAATEKARLAEQERARLATEGAQQTQQAKAAAAAKAAEDARLAAEKAQQAVQQQAATAEQKRVAAEKAADTEKVGMDDGAADHASTGKPAAGKAPTEPTQQQLAALPNAAATAPPSPAELAKSLQVELRRVGCLTGAADGEWNKTSRRALELFNKNAGTKLDVKLASLDALDAIKLKSARVCPLICETGFRADGDRCVKISCAAGSFLNEDGECEKRRPREPASAKRDRDERPARVVRERPQGEAGAAKPSGQMVCDRGGCRPVARGCHVEFRTTAQGGPYEGGGGNVQICN